MQLCCAPEIPTTFSFLLTDTRVRTAAMSHYTNSGFLNHCVSGNCKQATDLVIEGVYSCERG